MGKPVLIKSVYMDQLQPDYELAIDFRNDGVHLSVVWCNDASCRAESVFLDRKQAINLAENILDRYREV